MKRAIFLRKNGGNTSATLLTHTRIHTHTRVACDLCAPTNMHGPGAFSAPLLCCHQSLKGVAGDGELNVNIFVFCKTDLCVCVCVCPAVIILEEAAVSPILCFPRTLSLLSYIAVQIVPVLAVLRPWPHFR